MSWFVGLFANQAYLIAQNKFNDDQKELVLDKTGLRTVLDSIKNWVEQQLISKIKKMQPKQSRAKIKDLIKRNFKDVFAQYSGSKASFDLFFTDILKKLTNVKAVDEVTSKLQKGLVSYNDLDENQKRFIIPTLMSLNEVIIAKDNTSALALKKSLVDLGNFLTGGGQLPITFKFCTNDKLSAIDYFNKLIKLFFLTLSSSLCVYFDQKLLIIPLFCFIKIILSNENKSLKILAFLIYLIFSIPYLYLIILWGNIIPTTVSSIRNSGEFFYFSHLGFTLTIIGFYFIPLFFFKENNIKSIIKSYFKNKKNLLIFLFFIIYLIFSIFLDNYQSSTYPVLGKGVIHKLSLLLFNNFLFQKIFMYFNFIFFYFVVSLFLGTKITENLIILYFLISSIFIFPILQEYYDPLILIFVFIFFNLKLKINYKNIFLLFFYLLFLLIIAKIYYFKNFLPVS